MHTFFKSKKAIVLGALLIFTLGNVSGVSASTTLKEITAYLDNGIHLVVNGLQFTAKDTDGKVLTPINYEGNTYLPLRSVAEATGLDVKWDDATRTARLGDFSKNLDNTQSSDLVLKSKDNKFQITLPNVWNKYPQITQLNPTFSFGAIHNKNEFVGIIDENKADFGNYTLDKYVDLIIGAMDESASDLRKVLIDQPIIDGKTTKQYEIHATFSGLQYVYIITFIEGQSSYYQVFAFTTENNFENAKDSLKGVSKGFKENESK
jgi:hypothetical protein